MNISLVFPALELQIISREQVLKIDFSNMPAPRGEAPSLRIMMIEIRGRVNHVLVAEVAVASHDRASAGRRLKSLG